MSGIPFYKAEKIAEQSYKIYNAFTSAPPSLCYLTVGRDYALLIDTSFGWGDLKAFCGTLTDKPVKVVNTHSHGDHVVGNSHFDHCYMHRRDIRYLISFFGFTGEENLKSAKGAALPEYKDLLTPGEDFKDLSPIAIYPIEDGDIFDLGDRQIEVIYAGGHTPGSIILKDPKTHIAYTGDFCNSNTLMEFKTSLSVEAYLQNLKALRPRLDGIDMMYGGHEILAPSIVDEAIETCAGVIAGTDDKFETTGMFGQPVLYAAAKGEDGKRLDGGSFNMSYDPAKITGKDEDTQVISLEPEAMG